jgi:hypothetical protein
VEYFVPQSDQDQALDKAKAIALPMKIAPNGASVNFFAPSTQELWDSGVTEELLYYFNEEGAIHFEAVGEDGFTPIFVCSTTKKSPSHLLRYLDHLASEINLTKATPSEIYQHNPSDLKKKINTSREHIETARIAIKQHDMLAPMGRQLSEIERHFESLSNVADNYAAVYSNILKPVEEEGKKGVRTTVAWAIIGIIASVLISNFEIIAALIRVAA